MKPATPPRDWRRIHHSPIFWIGIVLCLAAITIYVWSDRSRMAAATTRAMSSQDTKLRFCFKRPCYGL